jgi:hypothetical protein
MMERCFWDREAVRSQVLRCFQTRRMYVSLSSTASKSVTVNICRTGSGDAYELTDVEGRQQ